LVPIENIDGPVIKSTVILPSYCNQINGSIQINAMSESPLMFSLDEFTSTHGYFNQLGSGFYNLIVEDTFGCTFSQEIFIPDTTSLHIEDIKVTNTTCKDVGGEIEIKSTGDNVSFTIEEFPGHKWFENVPDLSSGIYHIRLIDTNNCTIDTAVNIFKDVNCYVDFPNIFSPNGDQINDKFGSFLISEFAKWKLEIFDRSGNMVFSSNDPNISWDGTFKGQNTQSGVYTWYLRYILLGGDDEQSELGNVTLLR
jgi:gliding motility-associated-like protein